MIIVIPWAGTVQGDTEDSEKVRVERPKVCPACGYDRLIFWGGRFRFATSKEEDIRLYVRRVKCRDCGETHTLSPDFLFYRRVFLAELIVQALSLRFLENAGIRAVAKHLGISRSTIFRWVKRFAALAESHYRRLSYLYHTHFPGAPPPPVSGNFPSAFLNLARRFFLLQTSQTKQGGSGFASWLSLYSGGYLLS